MKATTKKNHALIFTDIKQIPNPEMDEYRVIVRDLAGKAVLIDRFNGETYSIQRGNLATGIYTIELTGKKIYRDRFMVK